jgi:hypothetical protein
LVDDLKGGKLSVEEEQKLSEYFMSHKFLENRANLEEKEIIKYTALGWFIYNYNKKPVIFKKEIKTGARMGRSKGIDTGFKWIANATIGVE